MGRTPLPGRCLFTGPTLRHPEPVVRPREGRIESKRRFEMIGGHGKVRRVQCQLTRGVLAVGLGRVGQRARQVELTHGLEDAQGFASVGRNGAGQCEQLVLAGHLATDRSERVAAADVDDLRRQDHRVSARQDLADQHHVGAGDPCRFSGHRRVEGDRVATSGLAVGGEHLGGRDDVDPSGLGQVGGDEAHQHTTEIARVARVGQVLEADHAESLRGFVGSVGRRARVEMR